MKSFGFMRVGAAVSKIKISDVKFNVKSIKKIMDEASRKRVEVTTFQELSLVGYTCADLFLNEHLINSAYEGLIELKNYTKNIKGVFIVGVPINVIINYLTVLMY